MAGITAPPVDAVQPVEELFERYKQVVFRYVLSVLRDFHAAEDVTQEVFLNLYRFEETYRGEASVQTWIFAIAKNAIADHCRKNAMEKPYCIADLPDRPDIALGPEDDFQTIIASLDKFSQNVVSMHLIGGLRHREIAAILGETESAIKKRYSRALKWLRRHYTV